MLPGAASARVINKHGVCEERGLKPKVVVVMPAYNASRTVRMTYEELPKDQVHLVILVDNGQPTTRLRSLAN